LNERLKEYNKVSSVCDNFVGCAKADVLDHYSKAENSSETVEQGSNNASVVNDTTPIVIVDQTVQTQPIGQTKPLQTVQTQPISTEKPQPSSSSVSLHSEKTIFVKGEDILFKLSVINLITKPTMHVQVIIIPSPGMSVSSSEFVMSGAGQYMTIYDMEPGQGKDIEVKIAANQVGNFNVKGRVVYYFKADKSDAEDYTFDLPIQVSDNSPIPKSTPIATPSPPHISGFYAGSLVFLLILVFILRRK
jgi:hypothetical protein